MGAALYESRGSSIAEGQESRERSPEVPLTLSNHLVVGAAMQLTFEGVGCELAIFEAGLSRLPRGQRSQWRRSSALRRFCWRRRDWSGSLFKAGALEKLPYRWWMFCDRWCPCRSSTRRSTAIGARASVRKKAPVGASDLLQLGESRGLDSAPRPARCNVSPRGPIRRRSYNP